MCVLRDDFLHLSYRVGRDFCQPPGCDHIPFVVYGLPLSGSVGIRVEVDAEVEEGGAFRTQEEKTARREWSSSFVVWPGYFRSQRSQLPVKERGWQQKAMYRHKEVVADGDEESRLTELVFTIRSVGLPRQDEEAADELRELMASEFVDSVTLRFVEFQEDD